MIAPMRKSCDNSPPRAVISSQTDIHRNLAKLVSKHLSQPFRKPFAEHNLRAFEQARQWLDNQPKALIFDSFCGVGESTLKLAQRYPDCAVVGIDKSAARLNKHHAYRDGDPDNYLLVQADVDDFWRLANQADWQLQRHFLLYPNPWPKPDQLKLRVQGSPVFADLLKLGGDIELRSNWSLYVREFAEAMRLAGGQASAKPFTPEHSLTPFERKYAAAGQTLWHCQARAPGGN